MKRAIEAASKHAAIQRKYFCTKDEIYKWMRDYYTEQGWDIEKRIPTKEKLSELGLEKIVHIVEPYLA
ncbi:MAG TPA: hypothetical protein G4O09_08795 [Dehalococcoidia bacterium]|nr:hypothetical protein [Dehalococcoidia bacterium]